EKYKNKTERNQHLVHRTSAAHTANEAEVKRRPERCDRHWSNEKAGPVRAGQAYGRITGIGSKGIERAMREIDEVEKTEDDREPDRQEKKQHGKLQAMKKLYDPELQVADHWRRFLRRCMCPPPQPIFILWRDEKAAPPGTRPLRQAYILQPF